MRCGIAALRPTARVAVSIAEVARDSLSADGPGVRHAEQIANAAGDGEVWVSAAAGMLLAGSGLDLLPVSSRDDAGGQSLLRVVGRAGPATGGE